MISSQNYDTNDNLCPEWPALERDDATMLASRFTSATTSKATTNVAPDLITSLPAQSQFVKLSGRGTAKHQGEPPASSKYSQ